MFGSRQKQEISLISQSQKAKDKDRTSKNHRIFHSIEDRRHKSNNQKDIKRLTGRTSR